MDKDEKKQVLQNKMQKRDEERVTVTERRKESKESEEATVENSKFFETKFKSTLREIQNKLDVFQPTNNEDRSREYFDDLLVSLQKLLKYMTDSTIFLTAYRIGKCQTDIAKLQHAIQEKRDIVVPKKKFAFKTKKKAAAANHSPEQPVVDVSQVDGKKPVIASSYDCGFSGRNSESLVLSENECTNKDVALSLLNDCQVRMYGSPGAVHLTDLTRCIIMCGPCSGSIFVDKCTDTVFVLACQQLRIHTTTKSKFYIHVTSKAIIEDCSEVVFGLYAWLYDKVEDHYQLSGLSKSINNWDKVDDFNWLASDKHSPNWALMEKPDIDVKYE